MKIISIINHVYGGNINTKEVFFEDDTMIEIDLLDNSIFDMDGMAIAPKNKIKAIETKLNIIIND